MTLTALRHFDDPMAMEGVGYGSQGVGRGLGTPNIVPGMPWDHPASIPGVGERPEAAPRPLK